MRRGPLTPRYELSLPIICPRRAAFRRRWGAPGGRWIPGPMLGRVVSLPLRCSRWSFTFPAPIAFSACSCAFFRRCLVAGRRTSLCLAL